MEVSERFRAFLSNISLTFLQLLDGYGKHSGIRNCLNREYYNISSDDANSMLVGSWGKETTVRPPRDIDVLFRLPFTTWMKFALYTGNRQSALLQEVREVLLRTYPRTAMRADGQVVVVPFDTCQVEVIPAFAFENGRYEICDTNNGGRYKDIYPYAEIQAVGASDTQTNGQTRALIRMMKTWQRYRNVSMKSFILELLAIEFLSTWEFRGRSIVYHDWMVRDFLGFLCSKTRFDFVLIPGSYEVKFLGDEWKTRAQTAYERAVQACWYEGQKMPYSAGSEWQEIFGPDVPIG